MVLYNQKCVRCPNMVPITSRNQFPLCYDCQKKELQGEIKDPKMKKLFDVPEEFYKTSQFLRSIKIYYLKWGKISEKQLEYFKKTVKDMKAEAKTSKKSAKVSITFSAN